MTRSESGPFYLRLCKLLLLAWSAAIAVACANVGPLPPDAEAPSSDEPYVIGHTDLLTITVWKNPELAATIPVRTDGKISFPLLDDVQAAGLTPEELKAVITESLREYVAEPDVTVVVREMNSKTVSVVGGGVLRSGSISIQLETRVLDAIARVGGFSQFANKSDIRVLRRQPDGAIVEYRFNYDAFIEGAAPHSNFRLKPGDTIIVPD